MFQYFRQIAFQEIVSIYSFCDFSKYYPNILEPLSIFFFNNIHTILFQERQAYEMLESWALRDAYNEDNTCLASRENEGAASAPSKILSEGIQLQ